MEILRERDNVLLVFKLDEEQKKQDKEKYKVTKMFSLAGNQHCAHISIQQSSISSAIPKYTV